MHSFSPVTARQCMGQHRRHDVVAGRPCTQACTDLLAEGCDLLAGSQADTGAWEGEDGGESRCAHHRHLPTLWAQRLGEGRRGVALWRWNQRAPEGQHTEDPDASLARLVGHFTNTRAKGPTHVFAQRHMGTSWYAWYHGDLPVWDQPSEPRGTHSRACVARPGMLSCLFLQDVAHPLSSVHVWGLLCGASGAVREAATLPALTAGGPMPR